MLVRFLSSETGEILMFADAARPLLQAIGKATTARGVFTQAEMAAAAQSLREAAKRDVPPVQDEDERDATGKKKEPIVTLSQRAWPLVDMLERTSKAGPRANIVWEAAADF